MAELKKNPKTNKSILYSIFNPQGNGKGLTKEEAKKPRTLGDFFKFFWRNFNLMFALNIFAVLGNFPILFGLFALTGNLNTNSFAPASSLFAPLYGTLNIGGANPVSAALFGVHGVQSTVSEPTTATYVFFGLTALVLFTFGIVNVATAYIMRNTVKGDPVSFLGDIAYSIKRNWQQGLFLGIFDLVFLTLIVFDLIIFYLGSSNVLYSILLGIMAGVALIYLIMRYYMYTILVTFDLSIYKIIKNSFIFAILGIKRNIVAILGTIAVVLMDYYLLMTFMPLGIILPLLFLFSFINFMGIYAAYPKIKEIMIDPYYVSDSVGAKELSDEDEDEEEFEEPIFKDRG